MEDRTRPGSRPRKRAPSLAAFESSASAQVWPFDVVKTQRQSGHYPGLGALDLLRRAYCESALYRGLLPGLVRSSIANGTSMMVYKRVHAALSHAAGREGRSNI